MARIIEHVLERSKSPPSEIPAISSSSNARIILLIYEDIHEFEEAERRERLITTADNVIRSTDRRISLQ